MGKGTGKEKGKGKVVCFWIGAGFNLISFDREGNGREIWRVFIRYIKQAEIGRSSVETTCEFERKERRENERAVEF